MLNWEGGVAKRGGIKKGGGKFFFGSHIINIQELYSVYFNQLVYKTQRGIKLVKKMCGFIPLIQASQLENTLKLVTSRKDFHHFFYFQIPTTNHK